MSACLKVAMVVVMAISLAPAESQVKAVKGKKVAISQQPAGATSITSMTASPGTINFSATDPDLGSVAGSSAGSVVFSLLGGHGANVWTVTVQAATSTFSGCTTVPASAVTATCTSVVVTN